MYTKQNTFHLTHSKKKKIFLKIQMSQDSMYILSHILESKAQLVSYATPFTDRKNDLASYQF